MARLGVSFWRPRAPPGYSILGDCVTMGYRFPSSPALAVSLKCGLLAPPAGFKLIWSAPDGEVKTILPPLYLLFVRSISPRTRGAADERGRRTGVQACVWWPIAPQGFKSLGCIVNFGTEKPNPGMVSCIRYEFVTSAPLAERLIVYPPTESHATDVTMCCWCIDNLVSSFLMTPTSQFPGSHLVCELRSPLFEAFR
jgi:vacuolar protein sorting-associated protein 13A/C